MWARVLNLYAWVGGLKTTDLRTIVSDLLRELHSKDGHSLVGIKTDQNWCTNLREDLVLLLEALLDVMKDRIFTEIV